MAKRYKFKCWNCGRNYTLQREITKKMTFFVACPYCEKEAIVDLNPFLKEEKRILRTDSGDEQSLGLELQLPETLLTTEIKQEPETE